MRIGIITHHWVYNFGANLQALSTYAYLSKRGHEVWILNYRTREKQDAYRKRVLPEQVKAHEDFSNTYLRQTPLCNTTKQLIDVCNEKKFDAIFVGSDAMFRLARKAQRIDQSFPNPFWLTWVKSCSESTILTGSIAVSAMGTNYLKFPRATRQGIHKAIHALKYISVRDRWTRLMLFLVSNGTLFPDLCPDPVFILNDVFEVSNSITKLPSFIRNRYILLSFSQGMVSDQWLQEFVHLCHKLDLSVVTLPFPEAEVNLPVDHFIPLPLSPLSWYSLIKNSSGFLGVRMHPIVCCMANNIPFVSFDTYTRDRIRITSKTYDLCSLAKAQSFCISPKQIRKLSPQKALDKLLNEKQSDVKYFAEKAKQNFSRTINKLLLC